MTTPTAPHVYLSTACLHGNHGHCAATTRQDGAPKTPAVCKWCGAPCVCECHRKADAVTSPEQPACCDMHNAHCEPPADLCCGSCTEASHGIFRHTDGTSCVLGQGASPEQPETSGQDDELTPAERAAAEALALALTSDGSNKWGENPVPLDERLGGGLRVIEPASDGHLSIRQVTPIEAARVAVPAAAPHIRAQWAAAKAYEIRAELVCCDTYERNKGTGTYEPGHAICYWGEGAARLVEGTADDE